MFFEIMRLAKEIKPSFLFLENVPAITTRGGLRVVKEIASMGYDCRWCVISAVSIGALHKRERWFLLGCNTNSKPGKQANISPMPFLCSGETWRNSSTINREIISQNDWKETLLKMDKSSDGIPYQVDRLRALGNSVVPQQVRHAFKLLIRW